MPWTWVSVSDTLDLPEFIGMMNRRMKDVEGRSSADLARTVLTDAVRTITVTHTWSASQTFGAGIAVTGNSTIIGTLTALTGITSSGTAAFAAVTASGTLGVTGVATFTAAPVFSSGTASQTVELDAGKALTTVAITGTGSYVKSASPTLTGTISGEAMTLSGALSAVQITSRTAAGSPVHNLRMAKTGASGTSADALEYAGAVTALADDTATHIAITDCRGLLFVWVYNEAGGNAQASIFSFISGTRADQLSTGGNATIANAGVVTLAGTTGTDAQFNIGFFTDSLYFENRLGYTVRFAWKIIRV